MMCEFCRTNMAARTQRQLDNRLRNMRENAQVGIGPCPQCGGSEWATTLLMVQIIDSDPLPWWRRWFRRRQ